MNCSLCQFARPLFFLPLQCPSLMQQKKVPICTFISSPKRGRFERGYSFFVCASHGTLDQYYKGVLCNWTSEFDVPHLSFFQKMHTTRLVLKGLDMYYMWTHPEGICKEAICLKILPVFLGVTSWSAPKSFLFSDVFMRQLWKLQKKEDPPFSCSGIRKLIVIRSI